ncbi:MAG TPA: RidA family protein [Ramlibacter sp.]|jgi:enamine deaminase RidA (YjgF/YER057c/UK114 family)|nr:RidA family protein [Ramlibacter sp.]
MPVERFGTREYAGGVVHTPCVRAGKWVFGTGLRATLEDGRSDPGVLRPGRPLGVPPQAQREAAAVFEAMAAHLRQAGSGLERVARLDQYYPDARNVDPYHTARKKALAGQVAPSTSVIVSRLLNVDASMDVQVLAATQASGYQVQKAAAGGLNVPATSGYAPHVRVGDMIFVAGQLARDASGNLAAEAQVPAGQLWNGTRIQLETDYLVQKRLAPALAAAGSELGLVLKAQVYLSHAEDLPAFWSTWSKAFGGRVPPTTVVPVKHPAFGTSAATIEVNIVAAHTSAASAVRDVECDVELIAPDMLPARVFDGVLFVAGLMGISDGGAFGEAAADASAPFYRDAAHEQMRDALAKAQKIFAAAGTDLSQVTRALQFHADLREFRSAWLAWDTGLRRQGLPFSAVEVAPELFAPGARVLVDLWGHVDA